MNDSRLVSFNAGRCRFCGEACGAELFRLVFGEFLGPVRCKLALVALRNVEFATFSNDGGSARRNR